MSKHLFYVENLFYLLLVIITISNIVCVTEYQSHAQEDISEATCFISEMEKILSNHPIKEWRDYYYNNTAYFWARSGNISHVFELAEKAPLPDYKSDYYLELIQRQIFFNEIEGACKTLDSIKDKENRDYCTQTVQRRYVTLKKYSESIDLAMTISNLELRYQSAKDTLLFQFKENRQEAIKIVQKIPDPYTKTKILGVVSFLYEDEKNWEKGKEFLLEAYSTAEQIKDDKDKLACHIFLSGNAMRLDSKMENPSIWEDLRKEIEQIATTSQNNVILKQKMLEELGRAQIAAKYHALATLTFREVFSLVLSISDLSIRNELLFGLSLCTASYGNEQDTYNFLYHVTDKSKQIKYCYRCIKKMKDNDHYIEAIKFIIKIESSFSSTVTDELRSLKLDLYREIVVKGKYENALKFANTISDVVPRLREISYIATGLYQANEKEKASSLWKTCFATASAIARQEGSEFRKILIINNILYSQILAGNIDDVSRWIRENAIKEKQKDRLQWIIIALATAQAERGFSDDAQETIKLLGVPLVGMSTEYTGEITVYYNIILTSLAKKKQFDKIQSLIPEMAAYRAKNPKELVYAHMVIAWSDHHEFDKAVTELKKLPKDSPYYRKALYRFLYEKAKVGNYTNSLEMIRSVKSVEQRLEILNDICTELFPGYDITPLL